ncbi:MAG: signal peptidase II [Treponema sp.]|jgi:signal peptidase II|nr:signal peptidase II [Treponema sp.]
MSRPDYRQTLPPFILTLFAITADQVSKAVIVSRWPQSGSFISDVFGNGLLEIYHVRNRAIAFSLGHNLPDILRPLLFVLVPVGVLVFLLVYYFRSNEFSPLQRWAVAGILGGGIGNLIDRVFRSEGVVDFISVKFFGILGFERWPTFNFADSFVVIFGLILLITMFGKDAKG